MSSLTEKNVQMEVWCWCMWSSIMNTSKGHCCSNRGARTGSAALLKCTLHRKPFCILYFLKHGMHGYTKTYVTQALTLFISPSLVPIHTRLHAHSGFFSPLSVMAAYIYKHTLFHRLLQQMLTPRYTGADTSNMTQGLFRDICLSVIRVIQRGKS